MRSPCASSRLPPFSIGSSFYCIAAFCIMHHHHIHPSKRTLPELLSTTYRPNLSIPLPRSHQYLSGKQTRGGMAGCKVSIGPFNPVFRRHHGRASGHVRILRTVCATTSDVSCCPAGTATDRSSPNQPPYQALAAVLMNKVRGECDPCSTTTVIGQYLVRWFARVGCMVGGLLCAHAL